VEEADAPLPPGWARAKDAQGRTYYWHTQVRRCMLTAMHPCSACDAAFIAYRTRVSDTTSSLRRPADQGGPVAAAKVSRCCQSINRLVVTHHGQVSGGE
jgi:hypothetical protein